MKKEAKEKFIEVTEELKVRYKIFTKEQLEQHGKIKLAVERQYDFEQNVEQD